MAGSLVEVMSLRGALTWVAVAALAWMSLSAMGGLAQGSAASTRLVYAGVALFTGDRYQNVFTVNPDGSGVRRLTHRLAWESDPTWSPDGRRIAYSESTDASCVARVCDNVDSSVIRVVDATTGHTRKLTRPTVGASCAGGTAPFVDAVPTWSPDGGMIAYAHWLNDPSGGSCDGSAGAPTSPDDGIYLVGVDGRGQRQLLKGPRWVKSLDWSPNGKKLAFVRRDGRIGLLDLKTGTVIYIGRGLHVDWSPDGRLLAVTRASGIYTASENSGVEKRVLTWGSDAAWSPDGKKLVFAGWRQARDRTWIADLFSVRVDGTGVTRIIRDGRMPEWRPRGRPAS